MSNGGTELAYSKLFEYIPKEILDNFQIVSRPNELNFDKKSILWVQDLPLDVQFMAEKINRDKFAGIVFVSSWQQSVFNFNMNVNFSESVIIKNAIEPIPEHKKPDDGTIRLIYHPTPHRGLEILVPVFIELSKTMDFLHLDVFSNFDIYGWSDYNEPFESLYQQCREHPNITYHGTQPNYVVRKALENAHIFSYPCIWRETSCMSAMEAMSAGCSIVAPDYGALPETLSGFHSRYDWTENFSVHAARFSKQLINAIENLNSDKMQNKLKMQKEYADNLYSWDNRKHEWIEYLSNINLSKKKRGSINWM